MNRALRPVLFASTIIGSGTVGYCVKSYVQPPLPPVVEPQKPCAHPMSALYLNGAVLQLERKQEQDRVEKEQTNITRTEEYYQAMYQALCTALIKGQDTAGIATQWEPNMGKQIEFYAKTIEARFKEQGVNVKVSRGPYGGDEDLVCTLQNPAEEE